jgi:hypothetical protein
VFSEKIDLFGFSMFVFPPSRQKDNDMLNTCIKFVNAYYADKLDKHAYRADVIGCTKTPQEVIAKYRVFMEEPIGPATRHSNAH